MSESRLPGVFATALSRAGMESDAPFDDMQWHVIEWRHRAVTRLRTIRDDSEALEAAGLRE